jgi:hypothetical protein
MPSFPARRQDCPSALPAVVPICLGRTCGPGPGRGCVCHERCVREARIRSASGRICAAQSSDGEEGRRSVRYVRGRQAWATRARSSDSRHGVRPGETVARRADHRAERWASSKPTGRTGPSCARQAQSEHPGQHAGPPGEEQEETASAARAVGLPGTDDGMLGRTGTRSAASTPTRILESRKRPSRRTVEGRRGPLRAPGRSLPWGERPGHATAAQPPWSLPGHPWRPLVAR